MSRTICFRITWNPIHAITSKILLFPTLHLSHTPNRTLFECNHALHITSPRNFKKKTCRFSNIYYSPSNEASQNLSSECSTIQLPLPINETSHKDELNLIAEFDLELHGPDDCGRCHGIEGKGIDIGITQKCFDAHTHVHSWIWIQTPFFFLCWSWS